MLYIWCTCKKPADQNQSFQTAQILNKHESNYALVNGNEDLAKHIEGTPSLNSPKLVLTDANYWDIQLTLKN